MTKAATCADRGDSIATARRLARPSEEDSRVRIQAPEPPPANETEVDACPGESAGDTDSDFIQFLCGRFELENRERGMALLSTLLDRYVATEAYPIHTLSPRWGKDQAG
jgi:hypothetical protein